MEKNESIELKLKSNIWKMHLYLILYSLMFFTPIIILFFRDNGLSITQIMVLQAVSSLIFVLLEVPSGYFADVFGRKKALLITGVFSAVAMLTYALGFDFYHFLFASILWAIAGVFISGADSALIYDTLKDLKIEKDFKKIWGANTFYYYIGVAFASVAGGIIGSIDYRYTFYAVIPFMFCLIFLSMSFEEPKRHKAVISRNYFLDLLKVIKLSVFQNKKLRWLLAYFAVIAGFIQVGYFLYQPYFELTGLNVVHFGLVFALFNVIAAISAKYSHILEEKIGKMYSLISIFILIGISYLLMGNFIYLFSFVFVVIIQLVKGFAWIVISDYVNQLTESSIRATVLSVKSLIERLFFVLLSPFIGVVVDVYSLQQALMLSGIMVLVLGSVTMFLLLGTGLLHSEGVRKYSP